ncbi:hypothetical protein [Comamonas thiooxydans]|uniref:hypothetical protein n=1 Tax=Comamonas thiooxydans TaxID=363952 RepID=UPI001184E035|nr:hypothetical protein [Comamonas thiooxydans]
MTLLSVFARKEPTTDTFDVSQGLKKKDTVFYSDAACTKPMARKPWHQSGHPRINSKAVTLNCWRWKLIWVSPL